MKYHRTVALICCLTLSSCVLSPGGRNGGGAIKGNIRVNNPATALILGAGVVIGAIIGSLPRKHVVVKNDLYESEGVFYQPVPSGYIVVEAPVGTWLDHIPDQHDIVFINSDKYFRYQNTWYRLDPHKHQYQVIDNPTEY